MTLTRRDVLLAGPAAALAFPFLAWAQADRGRKRVLVFTRSQDFEHDVVKVKVGKPSLVDRVLTELGARNNFDVECTKDGRIFLPETLKKFDAFFFMTQGDLAKDGGDGYPPMPAEGKKALLDAIKAGKGYIGTHCASDTFHSRGPGRENQKPADVDPYIAMIGGEFIGHGDQQDAVMRVVSGEFPGLKGVKDFKLKEEWYSLKNFQPDMHVILVQETKGMTGVDYQRPQFPATWARMHGKGRVFYTSMGHRDDVWTNPLFQTLLAAGINWSLGRVDADIKPNVGAVAPRGSEMPPAPPPGK